MIGAIASAVAFAGQSEPVQEIMAKVAANQDRAVRLRSAFVYHQNLLLRFLRGNGKTAREEMREYTVTPTENGSKKHLDRFEGRYEKDGKLIDYNRPGYTYKDVDIDGELIDELADELANEKQSRDGIAAELFPLTSRAQPKYSFALKGKEEYRGRQAFRIAFEPRKGETSWDHGTPWAGEVLVDAQDYEPIHVTTRLAKGLPVLVTTVLGTNLRGLGFTLSYEKFDEGIWFPVKYGAEFEVKALFFYKRKIAIALKNDGFQRALVATKVTFEEPFTVDKKLQVPEVKLPPVPPPEIR